MNNKSKSRNQRTRNGENRELKKIKSCFFEKIIKIDKSLPKLIKQENNNNKKDITEQY